MARVRLPLVGSPTLRPSNGAYTNGNVDATDQHYINCYQETVSNPATEQKRLYIQRRPAFSPSRPAAITIGNVPIPNGVGRGIFYNDTNDTVYIVIGTHLYADKIGAITEITLPGGGITGNYQNSGGTYINQCGFVQITAPTTKIFFCDGAKAWVIDPTTNVATQVVSAGLPSPHVTIPVYLDGYTFLLDFNTGKIYNSNVNDPTTWVSTSFITPEMYPDKTVAITKQLNQLVAIGKSSVEFFYDAGNSSGSPLARTGQAVIQTGTLNGESVATSDGVVTMLAKGQGGELYVAGLEGLKLKPLSTPPVERMINNFVVSNNLNPTSKGYGFLFRSDGHFFYCLVLIPIDTDIPQFSVPRIPTVLLYDLVEQEWTQYTNFIPCSASSRNGFCLLQDMTSGKYSYYGHAGASIFNDSVYNVANDTFTSTPITSTIITSIYDAGSMVRKKLNKLNIVGDFITPNIVDSCSISWTDNDYQSYSAGRSYNLSSRVNLTNLGTFRRRAFKLLITTSYPWRLEFLELEVEEGTH